MILKHGNGKITFIFDQKSKDPVYLVGDFNNWEEEKTPMTFKDQKWQKTINLKPGAYHFKYRSKQEEEEAFFNDWKADAYVKDKKGGETSVVIIN
jgi:1,4-alpha-glucan branching enzyme